MSSVTGIIEQVMTEVGDGFPGMEGVVADVGPSIAERVEVFRAVSTHLRAARSFFSVSNLPLSDAEREGVISRDFINEARIGQETLLRAAELLLTPAGVAAQSAGFNPQPRRVWRQSVLSLPAVNGKPQTGSISEAVNDLCLLCGALTDAGRVNFDAWCAFGRIVSRQVELWTAAGSLDESLALLPSTKLPGELQTVVAKVSPDALASDVSSIFLRLYGLLEILRLVEDILKESYRVKITLPFFTLLREETQIFLDLVRERTMLVEGLDPSVREHLDGCAYALRMESRKAFEHELIGLVALRNAPQVYAKVENAHGLLRDCFQQSIISVARAFDPEFDGAALFSNFNTKLEQSLTLRSDLWEVLRVVRRAGEERDNRADVTLLDKLSEFRKGSLRLLMYKDWEAFERFVDEVACARDSAELQPSLNRFQAFLETLFSQINMRAVLTNHPFVPLREDASSLM